MVSYLINDDKQLRSFFPNVWAQVPGEVSFFDKLLPHIVRAEEWLSANIVSLDLLRENESHEDVGNFDLTSRVYDVCRALVVAWALHSAAPSLDLKLDANGFATVGTSNLVPISAQRMERLMRSLASNVDWCIALLLKSLHLLPGWAESANGTFFAASTVQNMDFCYLVRLPKEEAEPASEMQRCPEFHRFLNIRASAIRVEMDLEVSYLSKELLDALRSRMICRKSLPEDLRIIEVVKQQICRVIEGYCINPVAMCDTVNYIRENKEAFPQWHNSSVATLFANNAFRNRKDSSGYFFY